MTASETSAPPDPEFDARQRRLSVAGLLRLAVWFALVTAILELLVRGVQKFLLDDVVRVSRDVVWMAPLGQLVIFLAGGLLVALAAFATRRRVTEEIAVGCFVFVTAFGLLLIPQGMHMAAAVLLAAGVAVQAARSALVRGRRLTRIIHRTYPLLLGALTVAAGAIAIGRLVNERRAIAELAPSASGAPNVILLVWDTVRAKSLSLYGHTGLTTPNLDRLARSGVVFDRAIAPSPWTLPSHASMFTGYQPYQLSTGWTTPLDESRRTLAESFRDAGYLTGGFAANVLYADWEHGLARGFVHYEDYTAGPGQVLLSTSLGFRLIKGKHGWEHGVLPYIAGYRQFVGRRLAESVDEAFLEWIDQRGDRPFFAFLNYFDAHLPYEPPAPFDTLFGPPRPASTAVERLRHTVTGRDFWSTITEQELAAERAAYENAIAYLDHRLGILVEELRRRELLDNTLILITSDHGEEFLEHGGHEHGSNLYLPQIHVPLIVWYEGRVPAGRRVEAPVSLRNVAATIADLSDLPDAEAFPGRSLAHWWAGQPTDTAHADREAVYSQLQPGLDSARRMRSLMLDRYHYIVNGDGRSELYDVLADPHERTDLATADAADIVRRWQELLADLTACDECCCRVPYDFGRSPPSGRPQLEQNTAAGSGRSPQTGQDTTMRR